MLSGSPRQGLGIRWGRDKKLRESRTVARSTFRGSGIAHLRRTSKLQKPHAEYVATHQWEYAHAYPIDGIEHIHKGIYRLLPS